MNSDSLNAKYHRRYEKFWRQAACQFDWYWWERTTGQPKLFNHLIKFALTAMSGQVLKEGWGNVCSGDQK